MSSSSSITAWKGLLQGSWLNNLNDTTEGRYGEQYGTRGTDGSSQSSSDSSSDTSSSSDVSTASSSFTENTDSIASGDTLFDTTFLVDFWKNFPWRLGRRRYHIPLDERGDEGSVEESETSSDRSYFSDQGLDMENKITDGEIKVSMSSEISLDDSDGDA